VRLNNKHTPLPIFEPKPSLKASVYPEPSDDIAGTMTDEQAIRKIGTRSSFMSKLLWISFIVAIVFLAWLYIQRSDAYDHRMDAVNRSGTFESGSPQMLSALRAALQSAEYPDVKERAIRNLGFFKDIESIPLFIKQLDEGGIVRRAAALALARIGSPAADSAKPALMKALPNTDAKDRPQVVWALAILKEPSASDAILAEFVKGLLQGQPGFDPKIVMEAIGIPKLSAPELTGSKEKSVRVLVATALSEAASPAVVEPLARIIQPKDEDPVVVRTAVGGLGRTGDPRAADALFQLMQVRPDMRISVIDALRKSTAAPQLAVMVREAKDTAIRRDIVRLLRKTHDARSADALATVIGVDDLDTKIEAAHGLAELGDARSVQPLLELARNEDESVGGDAIDALRELAAPEAGPALMKLYEEYPFRKAAILRAIGASHYQAAGPILEKELKGDDIGAAAKAIGELPYDKVYSKFVEMLKRPAGLDFTVPSLAIEGNYRDRTEVMSGLRYFRKPDPKAVKALMTIVDDPDDDFRLGLTAGACLGQIADDKVLSMLLEKIKDEKLTDRVRIAYVQGLWLSPNRAFAKELFPLFTSTTPSEIKRAAALAIGYAGDPSNDAQLIQMIGNRDTRRDAAVAIVLGGSTDAARKLIPVLDQDNDLREVLRMSVTSNTDDNFNLLNEDMFTSGQIYRRLQVAEILKNEAGEAASYSYVWNHLTTRLATGWQEPGGISPRKIREYLYKTITGSDPELRRLVAEVLNAMSERGLLLAARDAGIAEARKLLIKVDQVDSAEKQPE
jgi:HEAT repeat protein